MTVMVMLDSSVFRYGRLAKKTLRLDFAACGQEVRRPQKILRKILLVAPLL